MAPTPEDRRPPLTPQLALRVAFIGSFALALFAIIFFRLWFLQVLSGDKYVAEAKTNRLRYIDIPAARGDILDQSGQRAGQLQAGHGRRALPGAAAGTRFRRVIS